MNDKYVLVTTTKKNYQNDIENQIKNNLEDILEYIIDEDELLELSNEI